MEGVELAIPAVIAVPKLMGSDSFGGARVSGTGAEACKSDGIPVFSAPKIEKCSSLLTQRESPPWMKKESCKSVCQLASLPREDIPQKLEHGDSSSSLMLAPGPEGKQLQRKLGKTQRSGNGCLKRSRVLQIDNQVSQVDADDTKAALDKLDSHLIKSANTENSLAIKQKNSLNSKRAERRTSKVSVKAKYDPLSPRTGSASFASSSGGNNFYGMYGLKPDAQDITKLLDDISLDELLEGNYKCPNFGKDKGKKAASMNESILHTVRKSCSILQPRGSLHGKQSDETEVGIDKKVPSLPSTSNSPVASNLHGDNKSSHVPDLSSSDGASSNKDSCVKAEAPVDTDDHPLYQPIEIREHLALPPPKDLEFLLQEATKPAKCIDPRLSKPVSQRASLPPFPWSNNYNGHNKSSNDVVKLSSRSTCQGKWLRIGNVASFLGGGTQRFVDLDSLTYDNSLVPQGRVKYNLPAIEKPSAFLGQHGCERGSSSSVCPTASQPAHDSENNLERAANAVHSPRLLAAAQTLCNIASSFSKLGPSGIPKWPKQSSQKAMKARKSNTSDNSKDLLTPKTEMILTNTVGTLEHGSSSKKAKLSMIAKKEELGHIHALTRHNYWSAPRSRRSSPNRTSRDSVAEARRCNGSSVKASFMVPPPPPRVSEKSSNASSQKVREVVPMDWSRSRS